METPDTPMAPRLGVLRRAAHDQDGIAMMTAILVITLLGLLSIVATQLAFHNQAGTKVDRKRTQAVSAAEAGLDLTLLRLQSLGLPCQITGSLDTKPTTSSYVANVEYFDSYPVVTAPMVCNTATNTVIGTPAAAQVSVRGTTNAKKTYGDRAVQSLVKLNPIPGNGFGKAIFANGTLTFNNNATINGNVGNDGDVYTNTDFNCSNSMTVKGSIISQGAISMSNTCSALVDWYAKGNITASNSATAGRDAKSSQGSISLGSPQTTVGRDAIAKLSVGTGGTVVRSRVSGAAIPDPPAITFPVVKWNAVTSPASWSAAGYTSQTSRTTCAPTYTDISSMNVATANRVVVTTCPISWSHNTTITLAKDLAIFSTGGFTTNNKVTFRSSVPGSRRRLYLIVPHDAATMPCNNPGITTSNNTSFTDVEVFFYTPCTVNANNNNSATVGQIYSGSNVNIANLFTLSFVPLPVADTSGDGGGGPIGYQVDTVYKREIIAPAAS